MILVIQDVLDQAAVRQLRERLATMPFVDGATTAGDSARRVKNNLQVDMKSPEYAELNRAMLPVVARNETLRLALMPSRITNLRFSRYRDSMSYGVHVDNPTMDDLRSDFAFTLFLAAPEEYEGGELIMQESAGSRSFKLKPGEMVVYPATVLHEVAPVTRGERIAAFGWGQSLVRDAGRRQALYDIEVARRGMLAKHGHSHEIDVLAQTRANLMRMWAEM